jgi:hypothetical protein
MQRPCSDLTRAFRNHFLKIKIKKVPFPSTPNGFKKKKKQDKPTEGDCSQHMEIPCFYYYYSVTMTGRIFIFKGYVIVYMFDIYH